MAVGQSYLEINHKRAELQIAIPGDKPQETKMADRHAWN
jgi:hypothetical protein